MKHNVEAIVAALNSAQVRYFIPGGLAVVAHGSVRFTADVDLILDLDVGNLGRAIEALEKPGYRPRAPVPLRDFKVPEKREEWVREKARFGPRRVSMLHRASKPCFVGYDDLVRLKRRAGRPSDLADSRRLTNWSAIFASSQGCETRIGRTGHSRE